MHRANLALAGALCELFLVGPIGLWIAGLILRFAVRLTNTATGGAPPSEYAYYETSGNPQIPQPTTQRAVALPTVPRAMAIMFAVVVANFLVVAAIGMAAAAGGYYRPAATLRSASPHSPQAQLQGLIVFVVSFFVHAGMTAALLPSSFRRACVVVVVNWALELLAIAALAVVVASMPAFRHLIHFG